MRYVWWIVDLKEHTYCQDTLRQGYQIDWPGCQTLKLAKVLSYSFCCCWIVYNVLCIISILRMKMLFSLRAHSVQHCIMTVVNSTLNLLVCDSAVSDHWPVLTCVDPVIWPMCRGRREICDVVCVFPSPPLEALLSVSALRVLWRAVWLRRLALFRARYGFQIQNKCLVP